MSRFDLGGLKSNIVKPKGVKISKVKRPVKYEVVPVDFMTYLIFCALTSTYLFATCHSSMPTESIV